MLLDPTQCYRALRSHDSRFDGRFFVGVATTRIYCRPSCPARTPMRRNMRFYATAAAAEHDRAAVREARGVLARAVDRRPHDLG